ncbi:leucine-rich repeat protein [uncultured Ruminococcus sp.]|uniref:leucine-rich repeat protein n=1 Tax=uncultured Ruminococcus sp. TaxID=165186 RepID=UPI0025D607F9|nr:leucine-rich repeat protein [uncultured Ruminococcus sp.]
MKCTNCGNEFMGKFCPNCGTPAPVNDSAPVQNEQTQPTEPVVNTPEQTDVTQPVWETPVPENTPEQNVIPEPVQYNPTNDYNSNVQQEPAQPQQTSFGQQFTNSSNGGYTGQQFTNQPQTNAPSGKKGMSTGKIVGLVLGIVGGLILILCIIFGVVACNIFNVFKNAVADNNIVNSIVSEIEDYTLPEWEEDTTVPETSDSSDYEDYYGKLDNVSHCYYKETDGGVKITGYDNMYDYDAKTLTVEIPSKIDGKDVVELESLGVYNLSSYDDDEMYIKVVIPGSVKVIREYAVSFNVDIDEVVIEEGVETIEPTSFFGCDELKSVTVPKSVKTMDGCGIGLEYKDEDSYEESAIDGFVLYGAKGSTAESYAKENKLKFIEAK